MTSQLKFFENESAHNILEGFRYERSVISNAEEDKLLTHVRQLPFREFEFHGYRGKRRIVSFGWQYDYSGRTLRKAEDIPEFLLPLRVKAASFAGMNPEALPHVLVTEYGPGVGIGWHRDKAVFGQVVGISLLAPCVLRFRRKVTDESQRVVVKARPKSKGKWDRVNVLAEPRSAYLLTGPSRFDWEHSILRVDALRYSITFRNLRD